LHDGHVARHGGAGFIGCNFVRTALAKSDARIVVLDKLTYAGNLANLADVASDRASRSCAATSRTASGRVGVPRTPADAVVNFAAETPRRPLDRRAAALRAHERRRHVRAARGRAPPARRVRRRRARALPLPARLDRRGLRFARADRRVHARRTPYEPNSPYSASKAGADHLVRAYHATYGVRALITNCSNNYGPYQFPEKLIPLMILNALEGKPLPIYGDGRNVRDWLYVEDHCTGVLLALLTRSAGPEVQPGRVRRAREHRDHRHAVRRARTPAPGRAERGAHARRRVVVRRPEAVRDRPTRTRPALRDRLARAQKELGWRPAHDLTAGLAATVQWYLDHRGWCENVQSDRYQRERLGLAHEPRSAAKTGGTP
jgi:dTDP-glucose 4,6-dehydratase